MKWKIYVNENSTYDLSFKDSGNYKLINEPQIKDHRSTDLIRFGAQIKEYRQRAGQSISEVATQIGIDRSYLSKLENGHEPPTLPILSKLLSHFSITKSEAQNIAILAGYAGGLIVFEGR